MDTTAAPSEPVLLSEKVAFLRGSDAYRHPVGQVECRETHMSWVFLAGDEVLKLKKPVRFRSHTPVLILGF